MSDARSNRHLMHLRMIIDDGEEYLGGFVDYGSERKLMLEAPRPLEVGREIRLEPVDPAEDAWFDLRARVTHCYEIDPDESVARWGAPFYAIAVDLEGLSPDQELAIRRALLRIERDAYQRSAAPAM